MDTTQGKRRTDSKIDQKKYGKDKMTGINLP